MATQTQTPTKYLSCAETAKLVRAKLKEAFPTTKFNVRSRVYSGGASIDIYWTTDTPKHAEVKAVTDPFEGATFDGMQDMKSYREATDESGNRVHYGADYIFLHCPRSAF
jgi:hypothetical protein